MSRAESERRRQRRRERKWQKSLKRWHDHDRDASFRSEGRAVRLLSYTITEDRFEKPDGAYASLNLTDDERAALFEQVHENPQAAIPRLRALLEQAPDSPVLYNWLTTAYQATGDDESAERIAQANHARHPDYLFAKLNVAQFALARGELERFKQIFDGRFDLKLLYPDRDTFHISEFIGFAAVMIQYYVRVGEDDAAEVLFEAMEQIAPDAPATQSVREVLEHVSLLHSAQEAIRGLLYPQAKRRKRLPS